MLLVLTMSELKDVAELAGEIKVQTGVSVTDVKSGRAAAFFRAQRLTAGSSGWLAEAYARDPAKVDGLTNCESVLLSLNVSGQLKEKLCLIYPKATPRRASSAPTTR